MIKGDDAVLIQPVVRGCLSVRKPGVDPRRSRAIIGIFLELPAPDCYGVSHSGHYLSLCVLDFDDTTLDMGGKIWRPDYDGAVLSQTQAVIL